MTVTSELGRVWKETISKSNWPVQCRLFGWMWTMIWDMEGKKKERKSHHMPWRPRGDAEV